MQQNIIRALILSICLAVIALVGMQYYWMHTSMELRRQEFKHDVNIALKSVSEYLEKFEAVNQLKANEQSRFLFIDSDVESKITSSGGDTNYDYLMVEKVVQSGDKLEVELTEERNGQLINSSTETQSIKPPSLTNENTDTSNISNAMASEGFSLDPELRDQIANKEAFIGEIAKSLRKINLNEKLEQRIDSSMLDSLIALALSERGIDAPFEFGVYDAKLIYRFGRPYIPDESLIVTQYKTRLFKHAVVGKPGYLHLRFPKERKFIFSNSGFMLITSILVVLAIIYIFYWTVKAIIDQKRNSEIKNDFINNMTHELKTPISTISLAVEVLNDPVMAQNKTLLTRYLKMINEENKRLGMLVEEVLQSAALDKAAFKLKRERVNVADLVAEVASKMQMRVDEKKGIATLDIDAEGEYTMDADKVHLTNVFYNLMDNALKYSAETPELKIEVLNAVNQICVRVTDNGIGIAPEHLKKVFEKLYRVPTGNLHDVKGFGLGLNYVKTIVTRHGGTVDVSSVLGKGSTFSVYLPKGTYNDN